MKVFNKRMFGKPSEPRSINIYACILHALCGSHPLHTINAESKCFQNNLFVFVNNQDHALTLTRSSLSTTSINISAVCFKRQLNNRKLSTVGKILDGCIRLHIF